MSGAKWGLAILFKVNDLAQGGEPKENLKVNWTIYWSVKKKWSGGEGR